MMEYVIKYAILIAGLMLFRVVKHWLAGGLSDDQVKDELHDRAVSDQLREQANELRRRRLAKAGKTAEHDGHITFEDDGNLTFDDAPESSYPPPPRTPRAPSTPVFTATQSYPSHVPDHLGHLAPMERSVMHQPLETVRPEINVVQPSVGHADSSPKATSRRRHQFTRQTLRQAVIHQTILQKPVGLRRADAFPMDE